nr:hypothetical protein [uncultured Flavobacterium sp.]
MKPLSQHIQETLNNESLKEAFNEKLVDEELDALTRVSPATKVERKDGKSLVDIAVSGK